MPYQVNFGRMTMQSSAFIANPASRFRIAVLGDFSASANAGRLETGGALAARKPLRVDCDNLDAVLARFGIKLKLQLGSGVVEIPIASMDDFHPDQLYHKLALFGQLAALRQRLNTASTFATAAAELQSWAGDLPIAAPVEPARGSVIPSEGGLNDFARLVGGSGGNAAPAPGEVETPISRLLREIVGPHVVAEKDPRQPAMVAAVDAALSEAMRSVLHHPDFLALEAAWRSVDFLIRRLETGEQLQVVLYDITAEEIAADLSCVDALEETGLYRMLVELPAHDAHQGAFSAIVGNYTFDRTPSHAELLGRLARIVARAPAPFVTALDSAAIDQDPKALPPPVVEAWAALAAQPESACLGLATPRFLLRLPYGDRSDAIESFDFEEFNAQVGLRGMVWGNPATLVALLLGQSFVEYGPKLHLGSIMAAGDMPFHFFTGSDGEQVALPCTERMLTTRTATFLAAQGFMPLVATKGSPEVRLASFHGYNGAPLAGPWAPVPAT